MMKKMIAVLSMCLMMMAMLTSCGGHDNTPEGVAEAAVKYLAKKDFKGYMSLTNATDQQKEAMAGMLEKLGQQLDQKGGLKDWQIVDKDIDEEGGKATVNLKITYEDGSEETNNMKMVKKDGEWLLSADK